jgi:hypothetical protein
MRSRQENGGFGENTKMAAMAKSARNGEENTVINGENQWRHRSIQCGGNLGVMNGNG